MWPRRLLAADPSARRWVVTSSASRCCGRRGPGGVDCSCWPGSSTWSSSTAVTLGDVSTGRWLAMVVLLVARAGRALDGRGGGPAGERAPPGHGPRRPGRATWSAVGPAGLDEERVGEVAATVGTGVDSLDAYLTAFLPAAALAVRRAGARVRHHRRARPVDHPHPGVHRTDAGPAARRHRRPHPGPHRAPVPGAGLAELLLPGHDPGAGHAQGVPAGRRTGPTRSARSAAATATPPWTCCAPRSRRPWSWSGPPPRPRPWWRSQVSFRLVSDRLSFGTALAVLVLTPEFFVPLRRLALEYHAGQAGRAAVDRIDGDPARSRCSRRPRRRDGPGRGPGCPPRTGGAIECRDRLLHLPGIGPARPRRGSTCGWRPARRWRWSGRAARARPPWRTW